MLCQFPGGGGGLPYETDGDARRKIRIKPFKRRPIWAWLRRYLNPKGDHAKTGNQIKVRVIFNCAKD